MIVLEDDRALKRALRTAAKFTGDGTFERIRLQIEVDKMIITALDTIGGVHRILKVKIGSDDVPQTLYLHKNLISAVPNRVKAIAVHDGYIRLFDELGGGSVRLDVQKDGFKYDLHDIKDSAGVCRKIRLDTRYLKNLAGAFSDAYTVNLCIGDTRLNPVILTDPDNEDNFALAMPIAD